MKPFVIILSFLLFAQSFALCKGTVDRFQNLFAEASTCSMNANDTTTLSCTKKSCCQPVEKNNASKKDSSKGCCGDDCRCFCCVKVFNSTLHSFKMPEILEEKYNQKSIAAVNVHSFDYHASISYPPQI